MEITVKQIDEELYKVMCGFWDSHGWPHVAPDLFPKTSYMAFYWDKPIIAGCLYRDVSSAFGIIDWIVASKDATKEEKAEVFPKFISHVLEQAKSLGIRLLSTMASHGGLIQRLNNEGFVQTDKEVTLLFKELS